MLCPGQREPITSSEVGKQKSIFIFGEGNMNKAFEYSILKGKLTINDTPGGKWLNQFDFMGGDMPLTPEQSFKIWGRLSERYAESASGEITLFVAGSKADRVFYSPEFPTLRSNKKIQRWTYR